MRTNTVFFIIIVAVALSTMGSDCVNSPFTVSINLDPIAGCYDINPGDGMWDDSSPVIVISDLIDDEFEEDILGFRLFDIKVKATDNYPDGTVSGSVSYSLDGGPVNPLLSFSGQSSQFKGEGVSLLDPMGLITYDQAFLNALVTALNDPNFRPQTVMLLSSGSGPLVPVGVQVCVDVYIQADGQVN